jgi:acyl-CoA thioester hydrolase
MSGRGEKEIGENTTADDSRPPRRAQPPAPQQWPHLAGRMEGREHVLPVRVYYEDTDFSGFVYHANYLKFCERGRSDLLRFANVHHHALHWNETGGRAGFVVRHMTCDWLKPAVIDDVLEVRTRLIEYRGARLELAQRILRGEELLFTARVTAALVDENGHPRRLPEPLRSAMQALLWPEY